MKKILTIIVLSFIAAISCNKNNNSTGSVGKAGEITVNPLGLTPLSAVYTRDSVNTADVTVTVKGIDEEPDIIYTYPAGYGTEFPIHGMFPETQNTIIVDDGGHIITENVSIGTLSYEGTTIQKKYDVAVNNLPPEEKYPNNPNLYFMYNNNPLFVAAVSENGYVRYFQNNYRASKLVIENKKMVFYDGADGMGKNVDLLGNTLVEFPIKLHHDVIKVNDKYLYLSGSDYGVEDTLVETDLSGKNPRELSFARLIQNSLDLQTYPNDEQIFKQIAFSEDINNIYTENGQQKAIDWFHGNSIVYDSATGILYVSSRQRGVLAINYSEWKLIWWMADDSLKTKESSIPYQIYFKDLESLKPYRVNGDAVNDGPKNQHALFLHKDGRLEMFDNQGDENSNPNGSRYVEYRITGTHGNYTAQKTAEYRDINNSYSRIRSDVDFTGDNYQNLLILYAFSYARLFEVEINSGKELFNFSSQDFKPYRVDKMPLYYDDGRVYSEDCNLKNLN